MNKIHHCALSGFPITTSQPVKAFVGYIQSVTGMVLLLLIPSVAHSLCPSVPTLLIIIYLTIAATTVY